MPCSFSFSAIFSQALLHDFCLIERIERSILECFEWASDVEVAADRQCVLFFPKLKAVKPLVADSAERGMCTRMQEYACTRSNGSLLVICKADHCVEVSTGLESKCFRGLTTPLDIAVTLALNSLSENTMQLAARCSTQ